MGIENRAWYDASDLDGKCPKCGGKNLRILHEEYTKDEDRELLYTVVHCGCGLEFNIAND
jgi:hypothetical protein